MIRDGVEGVKDKIMLALIMFPSWEGVGLGQKITDKHDKVQY